MAERIGVRTLRLLSRPPIIGRAAVVGQKEADGPLGGDFDRVYADSRCGCRTFEQAESLLQKEALALACTKAGEAPAALDLILAGDLLNQNIASTFAHRPLGVPLLGQFGACSTMAQTLGLAAVLADAGTVRTVAAVTSSHFCTAERQFRFPLEYGCQRPQTSQWTATAAGAIVIGAGSGPRISAVCFGGVTDFGITDLNNMGAAMAPAAADTLLHFFADTDTAPSDYDLIVTGDLSHEGSTQLRQLMEREGMPLGDNYTDCGLMLYDRARQDVHAGGSGCGCSAAVLCATLLTRLARGEWRDILFVGTGALMSPVSAGQGESIPAIAHAVHIEK